MTFASRQFHVSCRPAGVFRTMVLLVSLLIPMTVWGKGEFSVTGPPGVSSVEQLKHTAVTTWLKNNNYHSYADSLSVGNAEKYILEYKTTRAAGNRMVLSGTLDLEALRKWVRIAETKKSGPSFKPLIVFTSSIPGLTVVPSDSSARLRDSALGQAVLTESIGLFQKFSSRAEAPSGPIAMAGVPKSDREIAILREYANTHGHNSALWVNVVPCRNCGGSRIDFFVYNLTQGRQVLARSDDLNLSGSEFASTPKVKGAVKASFQQLKSELDDLVAQGTIFTIAHRLVIEGLESYKGFKAIDAELSGAEFVNQAVLKRTSPTIAEFELLSSLAANELSQRIEELDFNGFRLRPVRVDSRTIVVRYSK